MAKKKSKQKKREKAKKVRYANDTVNPIVMCSTPLFLKCVVVAGSAIKYMIVLMAIMFLFVMGMLVIYILFGDGWKALRNFIVEFVTIWELKYVMQLIIMALPLLCWWLFSKYMMKHYKTNRFIVHPDRIILEKRNGITKEISYPMLKGYICRKKIRIGPDWIEIPYEDEKIKLYSFDKTDVKELFRVLEERCELALPREELHETIREYMIGWSVSYLFGIPCILLGYYVTVIGWMSEDLWSLNRLFSILFSTQNLFGVVGVIIILVGYMLKLIYFDSVRKYFEPYKEFIHVSL